MRRLTIIRNFAFLVMVSTLIFASRAEVLAYSCQYWQEAFDCTCSGPDWAKVIHCDFPDEEWEARFTDLWNDWYNGCNSYCEGSEYRNLVAYWNNLEGYSESWKATCIITWGNASGAGSPDDSYAQCDCNYWIVCDP